MSSLGEVDDPKTVFSADVVGGHALNGLPEDLARFLRLPCSLASVSIA